MALVVPAPARELADGVLAAGRAAGLAAVGVAPARPFHRARRVIEDRKHAGLHGGMHFTWDDPARATDPRRLLPGAEALVVGAWPYRRADPDRGERVPAAAGPAGRVARYSWRDHYADLRRALAAAGGVLAAAGWRARVVADDNGLVDREAAYRAGLGWYGKNANVLLPGRGSWFVLGAVVTDAPLPPSAAPVPDGCGACTRCIDGCPTGAIVAPGVVDARRCLAWLVEAPGWFPAELRPALGDRIYGCDDCQEVCPPNRAADRHQPPPAPSAADEPFVALLEVLGSPDEELLDRFGRWYIPRRQGRYIRRNALVALGNTADGGDPRVVGALAAALADPDPLIRGHAAWAAGRLGLAGLAAASLAGEQDPDVLAELAAATAEAAP
jgi:epoxyqueuosine reductase